MSSTFLDSHGEFIAEDRIIGYGSTGLVLLHDNVAVKIPLRRPWTDEHVVERNIRLLRHEQNIYRRLQIPSLHDERSNGIVRCLAISTESTHLAFMSNGALESYLQNSNTRPPLDLQLSWCREMTRTLGFIHERCVLVADIATRNFLLDSDLSIKFCDFSLSSLLPLGTDMSLVNDHGFTTKIDIGLLGTIFFEIVTGRKVQMSLFDDTKDGSESGCPTWPERKLLPKTRGVWLGGIIEGCWDGTFQNAHSLLRALDGVRLPST